MKTQIQFFQDLLPINFKYGCYLNTIISEKNGKDFRFYTNYELLYERFNFFARKVNDYFKKIGIKNSYFDSAISEFSLTVFAALSFSDCISKIIESSSRLNGAGKTTIVKLICRLYESDEGQILINGFPINQIQREILMEKIGTVFQHYKIFAMSVLENISLTASESKIEEITKETEIWEMIESLPQFSVIRSL